MAHIRQSIGINAPVVEVAELARDPQKWSSWWVNLGEAEKVDGDGSVGTVVEHSYHMAGIRFPVTTRVIENAPTASGGAHWRGDFDGPLKGWQTWDYEPSGVGTEVKVEITYDVPGKAIGQFADRLLVERLQERALQQTLENLKMISERQR